MAWHVWASLLALSIAPAATPADVPRTYAIAASKAYRPGIIRLSHSALLYRPANLPAGPAPLLVLLHGSGDGPTELLYPLRKFADQRQLIMLALKSRGQTWDLLFKPGVAPATDGDTRTVKALVGKLSSSGQVDPRRIVLVGFSDGASYALSLGTANPRVFRGIVALSPGFTFPPQKADGAQRIFIAHGVDDPILPFDQSQGDIVPMLRKAGLRPVLRSHSAGHVIDMKSLEAGLDYALGQDDG